MQHNTWIDCHVIAAPTGVVAGTAIAHLPTHTRVTVSGVVERIDSSDSFILRDHTGHIPVHLGPVRAHITVGMAVTVHGTTQSHIPTAAAA